MRRRDFIKTAGSAAALGAVSHAAASTHQGEDTVSRLRSLEPRPLSPFNVGRSAQLFVDRVLVRQTRGVAFTLHPGEKHPANPLVRADRPWEGWRLEIYGNALYDPDEKLFKMWYLAEGGGHFRFEYPSLYAVSSDGIAWEKPEVGTLRAVRGEPFKHNGVSGVHLASVMKDRNETHPARRYKMICFVDRPRQKRGYHTMVSPDGLNWSHFSREPIAPGSDVITGYYDERRRLYLAFPKIGTRIRGHRRRVFYVTTSEDFVHWTRPELALWPDLEDDAGSLGRIEKLRSQLDVPDDPNLMRTEFYGMGFHLTESCTLAFPWLFTINNNARYGNHEGPGELQLAVSRDLLHWERPFREPCVVPGELDEWDRGFFVTQSRALEVGDEVWLYYCGSTYTHGDPCLYRAEGTGRGTRHTGSIGLARWKKDRFVSVDAPAEGGALTTIPIIFSGDRLEINARTARAGKIVVEILDPAGKRLSAWEPSQSWRGDGLREEIAWGGGTQLAKLQGEPISLRFHLEDAQLFSFAFRKGEEGGAA